MNSNSMRLRRPFLLLVALALILGGPIAARAEKRVATSDLRNIIRPELLNAQSDPTLRYPVKSGDTWGWLDITRDAIRYTVVQPAGKTDHSFNVSRFVVRDLHFGGSSISFKIPKRDVSIQYAAQETWGPGHKADPAREKLGTTSVYDTLANFDEVLALVLPPPPPPAPVVVKEVPPPAPPKPAAPPSPPAIVLSGPPGAGENQTLEWAEPTVVIRGVAMDSTGIPVVSINGAPANMRSQTTQAAEFWSDPLRLQEGNNPIRIVASNAAHVEAHVALTVHYQPKPKAPTVNPRALGLLEIEGLLQGGVSQAHIVDLIRDRGIKFSPTPENLNALRADGATDELLDAIRQAAPPPQ